MGTTVIYNGVTLKNVLTREFKQIPIRDESNTDIWYQQFDVSVEAIVNADILLAAVQNLGVFGTGVGGDSAGVAIAGARLRLGEDRGEFEYQLEGNTILRSDSRSDNNNGPKVTHLEFVNVSPETIRIVFSIQIAKVDCTENPSPVVNNRWALVDDVDDLHRTRRTWRGKLRLCNAVHNPHDFRGIVVPTLQRGWRRVAMHFNATLNALELEYFVTDLEMIGEAAPMPAVKMSVTHTEGMSQGGQLNVGSISVRLDGDRKSDKRLMLERAMQIVVAKLAIDKLISSNSGLLKQLDLVDYSGEDINAVEARAVVSRTPKAINGGELSVGTILDATIGRPLKQLNIPDYDPDKASYAGPYATMGDTPAGLAGLFACFLQTPCIDNHQIPQTGELAPEYQISEGGQSPVQATYSEVKLSDYFAGPAYSDDHVDAVYNYASLESIIEREEQRIALPIARAKNDNGDTLATVRLAPSTALRRIKLCSERVGAMPKMILPKDFVDYFGIRHKLLKWTPNVQAPRMTNTGQRQFSIDVEYLYALNRVPAEGENISVGSLQWDSIPSILNAVTAGDFIAPDDPKGI